MFRRIPTALVLLILGFNLVTNGQSAASGTIAYVRGSTEIRLIDPDGRNDRRLWTHPDLTQDLGIYEIAWRPDGKELAFSSSHEAVASYYHADIFAIRPDGTGLRKITNPPAHDELAQLPKGTVTVTVRNLQASSTTSGTFIVYVAGADQPQQVAIPAGSAKTLTFKSVADFGRRVQPVVAMFGKVRWFVVPGVDVQPGRTVAAPALNISGEGFELLGAFRPVWRGDGSRVSFRDGNCLVKSVAATPAAGEQPFNPLFGGKNPMGTCAWDWGPNAPGTLDQVLYSENDTGGDSSVYQMTEGGTHPGHKLTQYSDLQYQILSDLHWLPDGSGFLFSTVNTMRSSANIFRYDFASGRKVQLTQLDGEFARAFSLSPDGRQVVFERCTTREEDQGCDLWLAATSPGGARPRLLVRNGLRPSWGR
jgi:TolB protein